MNEFLVKLWPYLCGGLIGWVLCGLQARQLKFAQRRERIVEVPVSAAAQATPKALKADVLAADSVSREPDPAAAAEVGIKLKSADDFTIIEGIGPKIRQLLLDAGITSFQDLAGQPAAALQAILEKAGRRYALARPDSWPEQAALAANNQWQALKTLQGELDGGVRREARS